MTGIYLITNKTNGKKYVGQSVDVEKRWKQHRIDSKKKDCVIYKAIRKYGIENFLFEVLEECPVDKLDEREIYWIDKLDTYNNGYNMSLGGDGYNLGKDSYSDGYHKQYNKQYKESHKEDIRDYQKDYNKQYNQNHKDEIKQRNKQYYQDHKEEMYEYYKQYRQDHKDEIKQYQRQYRASKKATINIQIEVPLW